MPITYVAAGVSILGATGAFSSDGGGQQPTNNATAGQDRLGNSQANASDYALDRLKNTYAPIEDQFNAAASEAGTPGSIASKEGQATADVAQAYAGAKRTTGMQLAARGLSPDSMQATTTTADTNLAQAADTAGAQTAARDAEINRGLNLKLASVGIGRGDEQLASTAAANASNAFAREGALGAQQYQMQAANNANTGYGIASIAKAANTAANGLGNWFNNNGGYSVAGNGSQMTTATGYNDAGFSQYATGGGGGGGGGDFATFDFKDGGVLPKGAALAARGVGRRAPANDAAYAVGGIIRGPGGPTADAIPAKLDGKAQINVSNGEGVLNESAVADVIGEDGVNVINALGLFRRALNGASAASRGIAARG